MVNSGTVSKMVKDFESSKMANNSLAITKTVSWMEKVSILISKA